MKQYDTIIVGAGPAGLRCAEILSKSDLSVLLIEKEKVVGKKICAGGITRKGFQLLDIPKNITEHMVDQVGLHSMRYDNYKTLPEPVMATVDRQKFGQWQLDRLKGTKVEFRNNTKLTEVRKNSIIVNEDEELGFRFLVGGDGPNSKVRKHLKLPVEKVLASVQYLIPQKDVPPRIDIYLDGQHFHAWYAWLFPHTGYITVGACCNPKYMSGKELKENFHRWLEKKGFDISHAEYQSYPISYDYRGLQFGNIYLVGEAAGMASGLTGEGIYQSLVSGEEAARLILDPGYKTTILDRVLKYNNIQHSAMNLLLKAGPLRNAIQDLIILIMRNKWVNRKISKGFS